MSKRPGLLPILAILIITIVPFLSLFSSSQWSRSPSPGGQVDVLYAGSLIPLMETGLGPTFRKLGYDFKGEGHGSVQNAKMILDGQRFPDVFISAGSRPMEILTESKPSAATWYLTFASGEIVIAYSKKSRFAEEFEKARQGVIPWYVVLSIPELKFLRTDPELDPKGYYMVIAAKLADIHYRNTMTSQLILRGERNPEQIRPEETMMTLLEAGEADAVAAYRHEAFERMLPFISLPPEVNLGHPEHANFYRQASYTLKSGKKVYGEPVVFAITIPKTVKNVEGAVEFIRFLFSTKAKEILQDRGFRPIVANAEGNISDIPVGLSQLIRK